MRGQPLEMLGKLCGLDVLILAAGHGQSVSALAVMLPRRDETGLTCSNQRRRDPLWAYQGAPALVEPRALSAFVSRSVLLRQSPSRGGLGTRPTGQLNRTIRARAGEGRAVDHIVLVYYCGHTGQRSLLGGHPRESRHCPARIRLGPVGSSRAPCTAIGRALGGRGGKGRAPWRRHSYRRAAQDPAPRWGHGERREARKGLDSLESECLERPGLPIAGARVARVSGGRRGAVRREEGPPLRIEVFDNQIEPALKSLKREMLKGGVFKEMKLRAYYEKPSVKRKRKQAEARRKRRKASARHARAILG